MFMFLKLWIKKNNPTEHKKALLFIFEIYILDLFFCSERVYILGIVAVMI